LVIKLQTFVFGADFAVYYSCFSTIKSNLCVIAVCNIFYSSCQNAIFYKNAKYFHAVLQIHCLWTNATINFCITIMLGLSFLWSTFVNKFALGNCGSVREHVVF